MWSDLISGPLLQGQMGIAKFKSAYNSLIFGPIGNVMLKQSRIGVYGLKLTL